MMPQREPLGCLNFFIFEVRSFKILQEPKDIPQKEDYSSKFEGIVSNIVDYETMTVDVPALAQSENVSFFSSGDQTLIPDEYECILDTGSDSAVFFIENEVDEEEKKFVLCLPMSLHAKLPTDWIFLSKINGNFFNAIHHIGQEEVVAVSFEGKSIGRHGQLSLIGVSTRSYTFLFDIIALKDEAFEKGLKPIFENYEVQKVVHDSRQVSDALFHLHGTSLVNVFDTQVADVFVRLNKTKGRTKQVVNTLPKCIFHYLNLTEQDIYPGELDIEALKNSMNWMRRPITNAMKEVAIKNVLLVRELRSVLLDHMMSSYKQAVDVYLGVLRNATPEELKLKMYFPEFLPDALWLKGFKVLRFGKFSDTPQTPLGVGVKDNNKEFCYFILNNLSKERKLADEALDTENPVSPKPFPASLVRYRSNSLSSDEEQQMGRKASKRCCYQKNPSPKSQSPETEFDMIKDNGMCACPSKSVPTGNDFEKLAGYFDKLTLKDDYLGPVTSLSDPSNKSVRPRDSDEFEQDNPFKRRKLFIPIQRRMLFNPFQRRSLSPVEIEEYQVPGDRNFLQKHNLAETWDIYPQLKIPNISLLSHSTAFAKAMMSKIECDSISDISSKPVHIDRPESPVFFESKLEDECNLEMISDTSSELELSDVLESSGSEFENESVHDSSSDSSPDLNISPEKQSVAMREQGSGTEFENILPCNSSSVSSPGLSLSQPLEKKSVGMGKGSSDKQKIKVIYMPAGMRG